MLSQRNVVGSDGHSGDDGGWVGFEQDAPVADLVQREHDDVLKQKKSVCLRNKVILDQYICILRGFAREAMAQWIACLLASQQARVRLG